MSERSSSTTTIQSFFGAITVQYTQFADYDISAVANRLGALLHDHKYFTFTQTGVIEPVSTDSPDVHHHERDEPPTLTNVLQVLTSQEFLAPHYEWLGFTPSYPRLAADHIPTSRTAWRETVYDGTDPTITDVVGAFLCLLNASQAEARFDPVTATSPWSNAYCEPQVELGMLLAFRDTHIEYAPVSPFRPTPPDERTHELRKAIANTLGVDFSLDDCHALLLSTRDKQACLRAASATDAHRALVQPTEAADTNDAQNTSTTLESPSSNREPPVPQD